MRGGEEGGTTRTGKGRKRGIQGGKEQRKKDRRQGWEVGRRQKECLGSERTVMCKIKINSTKSNKNAIL